MAAQCILPLPKADVPPCLQAWLDACAHAQAPAQPGARANPILEELRLLNQRLAAVLGETLPSQLADCRIAGVQHLQIALPSCRPSLENCSSHGEWCRSVQSWLPGAHDQNGQ